MPRKKKNTTEDQKIMDALAADERVVEENKFPDIATEVPSLAEQSFEFFSNLTPVQKIIIFHFSRDAETTAAIIIDSGMPPVDLAVIKDELANPDVQTALDFLGFIDRPVTKDDIIRSLSRTITSPMSEAASKLRAIEIYNKILKAYDDEAAEERERKNLRNLLDHCDMVDSRMYKQKKRKLPMAAETLNEPEET